MKVLNLMWGFNMGGIGKCFLTYAGLGELEPRLEIRTVCINLLNVPFDLTPLRAIGAETIDICNRGDISWIWKLRRVLRNFQPDAVFTHGFNGPVLMTVERLLGDRTPLLCSYHGEYLPPTPSRRLLAPVFNSSMHWIYRHMAMDILTVSRFSMQELYSRAKLPHAKVHCVPNGIDAHVDNAQAVPELPDGAELPDGMVLGYAGRLDPLKGLEYLLRALPMVPPEVTLIILGCGPHEETLRLEVRKLQLESRVFFLGFQRDVTSWLRRLDGFLLPSLYENHSIALLEAMRAGCPIIATDVGGNPESIAHEKEGLLVPPRNPEALAAAIRRLAADPGWRRQLGENARRRFEAEFTEEIMRRRLADWLLEFDPAEA